MSRLTITEQDARSVRAHFIKEESTEKYFMILGLTPTASLEDVKKAYRELCKKYHPDRLQQLGSEFKTVSEEKIKEINNAYAILKKKLK